MNLHGAVRSMIPAINPDTSVIWLQAIGYTTKPDGSQVPIYNDVFGAMMQIQGLSSSELQHTNFLNLEGVLRKVYCYGSLDGAVRSSFKGGDLLVFQDFTPVPVMDSNAHYIHDSSGNVILDSSGNPILDPYAAATSGFIRDSNGQVVMWYPQRFWKVVQVSERWPDVDSNGWTSAIISQQTDSTQFAYDSNGKIVIDSYGNLVTWQ